MADWIKTAKVGDKVVAVGNDRPADLTRKQCLSIGAVLPKIREVYAIRAINHHGGDRILIRLEGVDNSHLTGAMGWAIEPGFHYSKFRPVEPRKTDISVFTDMLKTAPAPVEEDA